MPEGQIQDQVERARRGESSPGNPHPFRSKPDEKDQPAAADPVNLFSGEYTLQVVDLSISGRGFGFQLVRMYASGRTYFGPWGFNWDHNYNVYLRELDQGKVAIWTGQLQEDIYTPSVTGSFESPTGVYATLERQQSPTGDISGYVLTYPGGVTWIFQRPPDWTNPERIPLVKIVDPAGNTQQLWYDSSGRLDFVIDTLDREIRFRYNSRGLLESVTDFADRTIHYTYAPDIEHLVQVITPSTPDVPEGAVTCYEYDEYQGHPALQHNIVRVIDPEGRTILENEYGSDPMSDDFNRVVRQYYMGDEYLYRYTRLRYVVPTPESINDAYLRVEYVVPCNPLHVYTFNYRGNLLDERFRLCADGSYRLWAMTYRYNKHGEMAELRRPNGLGMRFTYDEDNPDPKNCHNLLAINLIAPPTTFLTDREIWRFTYEPRYQQIKTATDEAGATTTYFYDYEENPAGNGTGNPVRIVRPSVTVPDGTTQVSEEYLSYNSHGQITESVSSEGHHFTYDYSAIGDLSSTVAGAGEINQIEKYQYDRYGYLSAIIDALGAETTYEYDALGQLLRLKSPLVDGKRSEIVFHYGSDGRLMSQETPRGAYSDGTIADPFIRHTFDFDPLSHVHSVIDNANTAYPRKSLIKRSSEDMPLEVVDSLGRVVRVEYDERTLPLQQVMHAGTPEERATQFKYDRNGNLVYIADATGSKQRLHFDAWDRLKEVELVEIGTRICYYYGVRDQLERMEIIGSPQPGQPAIVLQEASQTFDERGRLVKRVEGTHSSEYWYDLDSNVVKLVDERGNATSYEYDPLDRVKKITDPLGNEVKYYFDEVGNLITVEEREVVPGSPPEIYQISMEYDPKGRLKQLTDSTGNKSLVEYDDRDLLVAATNPLGVRYTYIHDLDGLINIARVYNSNQDLLVQHRWCYDLVGRMQTYIDPEGKQTNYTYNLDDRWSSITYADGSTYRRLFDQAGQLVREVTAAGSAINYHYGSNTLLEKVHYTAAPGVMGLSDLYYSYDGLARPVQLEQGNLVLNLGYDQSGRLVSESINGKGSSWSYDDAQGFANLTYPDGRVDRYELDALGRISRISLHQAAVASLTTLSPGALLAKYEYIGPQRVLRRELGNGCVTQYGYDRGRRLSMLEHLQANGDLLARLDYVYDAGGRRRVVRSEPAPGVSTAYTYDDLSRLTQAEIGIVAPEPPKNATQEDFNNYLSNLGSPPAEQTQTFHLNRAGARKQDVLINDEGTTANDYELNDLYQIVQMTRTTSTTNSTNSFKYDRDGRRIQDDRFIYAYDVLGRLREVHNLTGTVLLTQEYDPVGRVALSSSPEKSSQRMWYTAERLLHQETTSGDQMKQFCSGIHPDEHIAQSNRTDYWMHQDACLSMLAATDNSGMAIARYRYTPFGSPSAFQVDGQQSLTAPVLQPIFGGHPEIGLNGIYSARARIYDAETGCYLRRDPRGYINSANPYIYVAHNPVNLLDPTGELAPIIIGAVLVGVALGICSSWRDAQIHPQRYLGSFSWRTMFQTYAGALIGGVSGLAGEGVLASVGLGSLASGGATVGSGTLLGTGAATGGTLTLSQTFVLGGTVNVAGGIVLREGFSSLFPELEEPPNAANMAQDYALGGGIGLGFRGLEAVGGNPFSSTGWKTIKLSLTETNMQARALGNRLVGNAERAQQIGRDIAEIRVARWHADELQMRFWQTKPNLKLESLPYREPGAGQTVVFNPEVDVPTNTAWTQVKASGVPGRAARFNLAQAQYTAAGSPTGRSIYYVEPGSGYPNVERDLLKAGVSEVRPLTPFLRGTAPFPLPFRGASGVSTLWRLLPSGSVLHEQRNKHK